MKIKFSVTHHTNLLALVLIFAAFITPIFAIDLAYAQQPATCYANNNIVSCGTSTLAPGCYIAGGGGGWISTECLAADELAPTGSVQNTPRAPIEEFSFDEPSCIEEELNASNCTLIDYLVRGINVLSALAGMAIIGSVIFAGYEYMTARDNSGQISKARMRIVWSITAMALFVFMYALLNFIVPGGVL
jgi:hypothetical protein